VKTTTIKTTIPTTRPTEIPTTIATQEPTYEPTLHTYTKHLEKIARLENGYTEEDYLEGETPVTHRLTYNYVESDYIYTVTYTEINDYFKEKEHYYYLDPQELYDKLLYNEIQDTYMSDLISRIKTTYGSDENRAKMIISMVQKMPYDTTNYERDRYDWHYPYETVHIGGGVCSDKSILMAYLLFKLDFDVVIFEFDDERHSAVGIRCDPEYDYMDTGYAYVETTRPSIVTRILPLEDNIIIHTYPRIADAGSGYKKLNVKEYYDDSQKLDSIVEHFGYINTDKHMTFSIKSDDDKYLYDKYKEILKKYGL
jgi:hypothetical protein